METATETTANKSSENITNDYIPDVAIKNDEKIDSEKNGSVQEDGKNVTEDVEKKILAEFNGTEDVGIQKGETGEVVLVNRTIKILSPESEPNKANTNTDAMVTNSMTVVNRENFVDETSNDNSKTGRNTQTIIISTLQTPTGVDNESYAAADIKTEESILMKENLETRNKHTALEVAQEEKEIEKAVGEEKEVVELKVEDQDVADTSNVIITVEDPLQEDLKLAQIKQQDRKQQQQQEENLNNTIIETFSDIESTIKKEHNIAILKQQECELLKKQKALTQQIQQEQLLTQKLSTENSILQRQQEQLQQNQQQSQVNLTPSQQQQEQKSTDFTTCADTQDENDYNTFKRLSYESKESSSVSKGMDLRKLCTPPTKAEEILPKNRNLYASSAFYSATLHPTVEDQVELARRISHSLSDISNDKSKGQSMYVNRKKRSSKWVHEGCSQDYQHVQAEKSSTPISILQAYSDAGKHRAQLNLHQEQVLEKYTKPGLKVLKTPWEAALQTGSASAAFIEERMVSPFFTPKPSALSSSPAPQYHHTLRGSPPGLSNDIYAPPENAAPKYQEKKPLILNHLRDLAYKPSIPHGWKASSMTLPKELYVPMEIPLDSYAPPPAVIGQAPSIWTKTSIAPIVNTFLLGKPAANEFSTHLPLKPQYWAPTSSQIVPKNANQTELLYTYNPSPLPYEKVAKFENPSIEQYISSNSGFYAASTPTKQNLSIHSSNIRNLSPAPFKLYGFHTPTQMSIISPGTASALQQFDGYDGYCKDLNQNSEQTRKNNTNSTAPSHHMQNFNISARGWGSNAGGSQCQPKTTSIQRIEHLPYTDF